MSSSRPKGQDVTLFYAARRACWLFGCAVTLGYASKYYFKVESWQVYDPAKRGEKYNPHSRKGTSRGLGMESSIRSKQQREWDRLMTPLSVITATSAAALAIPAETFGTSNIYWLATAFFSGAFGLSLEGLIIITYLTVFGSGSSAETVGRIANGKGFLKGLVGPVAVVTALPTAITTYSATFLLAGLLAMTVRAEEEDAGIQQHMVAFKAIVLTPVCFMLLCLAAAIVGCEVFAWKEGSVRAKKLQKDSTTGSTLPMVTMPIPVHCMTPQSSSQVYTAEPTTGAPDSIGQRRIAYASKST